MYLEKADDVVLLKCTFAYFIRKLDDNMTALG